MKNLLIIIFFSILTYLVADFFYTKKKASFNVSFFSKGCLKNSSVFGYEYYPHKKCRYKRVLKNHVEYDNQFTTNNFGFVSSFDYQIEKKINSTKVAVLGYSMTEGNYIAINWPSRITEFSNGKFELYNFARAGYFNLNLYSLYLNLIKKFDFDFLLMPKIGATTKQFMIFEEREDGIYDGLFDNIPESQVDYEQNYKNLLNPMYKFFENKSSNLFGEKFFILNKNYLLFKKIIRALLKKEKVKFKKGNLILTKKLQDYPEEFNILFGERNVALYLWIIGDVLEEGKKVIFYQDPLKEVNFFDSQKDKTYQLYKWLKGIYPDQIFYFDGNDAFKNNEMSENKNYFFENDGHWNQKGSDIFAKHLFKFLERLR